MLYLCDAFGKSGQSGGSAPFTASAISQAVKKLMMFQTLAPLTGTDSEWVEMSEYNDGKSMFQNNRDSRVFKNAKDGQAYFIEAIVFVGNVGGSFIGNAIETHAGDMIRSSQYIKQFPFTPKTFYIDVIDHRWSDATQKTPDPNGEWWTHSIKNQKMLDPVFDYYDKMP